MTVKRRSAVRRCPVVYLPTDEIECGCLRVRREPDDASIAALAQSIAECGLLEPLTVRLRGESYELVAGERRLLAARLAGLSEVPCVLPELDLEEAGIAALAENLHRRELDCVELAQGVGRLIRLFGMSPEEAARRLGMSQEAMSEALELLRLPDCVLDALHDAGLSSRHGRALLCLGSPEAQLDALRCITEEGMSASEAGEYTALLSHHGQRQVFVLKDVRVFVNSVRRGLELLRRGGIPAELRQSELDDRLVLTVVIPKRQGTLSEGGH